MNFGGVIVHSNLVSRFGHKQQLQNGAQVLVRVIADKGNGTYEGSVAGSRLNFQSNKPLKPGSTFLATITTDQEKIYLAPKSELMAQESLNTSFQINLVQNEQLAQLLQQLGLPADELSHHLLQQLKQMGAKFDPTLLGKLRNLSLRFKGKEKSAGEILAILEEKGIKATEKEILQLLMELEGEFHNQNEDGLEDFSLINKVNAKTGKWYLLLFEIVTEDENQQDLVLGNGNVKLLLNNEKLNLMNVDCNYNGKKYLFSLSFENKICKKVYFNISPGKQEDETKLAKLSQKLKIFSPNVEIQWCDAEKIEGTACGTEEIVSFGGIV